MLTPPERVRDSLGDGEAWHGRPARELPMELIVASLTHGQDAHATKARQKPRPAKIARLNCLAPRLNFPRPFRLTEFFSSLKMNSCCAPDLRQPDWLPGLSDGFHLCPTLVF